MPQQLNPGGHDEYTRELPDGRTAFVQRMAYGKGRINVVSSDNWRFIDDSY